MTDIGRVFIRQIAQRVMHSLGYASPLTLPQIETVTRLTARIHDIHVRNADKKQKRAA